MNISASKLSHSFGRDCDSETTGIIYERAHGNPIYNNEGKTLYYTSEDSYKAERLCEQYLDKAKKEDLKSPLVIAGSVAASILATYAVGKRAGSMITAIPAMKNVPVAIEENLKTASKKVQNYAAKLISDVSEGTISKVKNIAGKTIKGAEKAARTGYKKIAYYNTENVINPERARRAFTNAAGAVAAASVVPQILTKDNNEDGIKDIVQKSQNAYTGRSNDIGRTVNDLTMIGELITALT